MATRKTKNGSSDIFLRHKAKFWTIGEELPVSRISQRHRLGSTRCKRRASPAIAALCAAFLPGCISPEPEIRTDSPKRLKAAYSPQSAVLVGERFLLIPIDLPESKESGFSSGSFSFSSSAWSGLILGKGGFSPNRLNLEVVNLQTNAHHAVFERQVALGSWDHSFKPGGNHSLWFDDTLILTARAEDSNGDKRIDDADARVVYAYKLSSGQLSTISPEGFTVEHIDVIADRIVLLIRKILGKNSPLAVYSYDPRAAHGAFVVDGLVP